MQSLYINHYTIFNENKENNRYHREDLPLFRKKKVMDLSSSYETDKVKVAYK